MYDKEKNEARLRESLKFVWLAMILKKRKVRSLNIRSSCLISYLSMNEILVVIIVRLVIRIFVYFLLFKREIYIFLEGTNSWRLTITT